MLGEYHTKRGILNLFKLFQITIIILVSSGTRKRSFSNMWQIKNCQLVYEDVTTTVH